SEDVSVSCVIVVRTVHATPVRVDATGIVATIATLVAHVATTVGALNALATVDRHHSPIRCAGAVALPGERSVITVDHARVRRALHLRRCTIRHRRLVSRRYSVDPYSAQ